MSRAIRLALAGMLNREVNSGLARTPGGIASNMLVAGAEELGTIGRLLANARKGISGALVVRGEAGVGKSTLLDHAVVSASDLSSCGVRGSSRRAS